MHDIWNPWHGCIKISEGCRNCYMFFQDSIRDRNGADIYRTKSFYYPLEKNKNGAYKVQSGEMLRVCMTSDFFLEESDVWRDEAWKIIRQRSDVKFFLLTKRPQRVMSHLPADWHDGYENVFFNVSAENQRRADERIPILLDLPFKHKGVMCAPFIGPVSLDKYLASGQLEQVICDGENYAGARECHYEWVKKISDECCRYNVTFIFCGTGNYFVKDGRRYHIEGSAVQSTQAFKSGLTYIGKDIRFKLVDALGLQIYDSDLYKPFFRVKCDKCGMRAVCNGCSNCGKCE